MPDLAPFPVDPDLTGLVIAYRNGDMIADEVLPRRPIGKQSYKYWNFDFDGRLIIPNTLVGRTSEPNTVEFQTTEESSSTENFGLQEFIPNDDIANAPPGHDPVAEATEDVMSIVELDREKRVADLVFAAATYPTGNKVTLSGSSRWSDDASDPIGDVEGAAESMVMRPNLMVLGSQTASKLRRHPKILKAWRGNDGGDGLAPISVLAQVFDIARVIVGRAYYNSANPGQTAARSRVWGAHCALLRIETNGGPRRKIPTFGWSAQWQTRLAAREAKSNLGLRGGWRVWAGESMDEKVTAAELGYLFTDAGDDS